MSRVTAIWATATRSRFAAGAGNVLRWRVPADHAGSHNNRRQQVWVTSFHRSTPRVVVSQRRLSLRQILEPRPKSLSRLVYRTQSGRQVAGIGRLPGELLEAIQHSKSFVN